MENEAPKENRKERLHALRTLIRVQAAKCFLDEHLESGVVLALAASAVPSLRVQEAIAQELEHSDHGKAVGIAGLALLNRRMEPMKGTWPGTRGWFFLDDFMKASAERGHKDLLLYLSRIALSAPLFLAASVAAALGEWGIEDPRATRLAKVVADQVVPMVRGMAERLDWILGPPPK